MLRPRGPKASERRRCLSDNLSWQQDQALNSSIYLLREMGPTGFLLREEEPETRDFRVFLGNPHVCNCSAFLKGQELCKHICWILLKKFKLPRNHEFAFQLGLLEGEINDLLRGIHQVLTPLQRSAPEAEEDGSLAQRDIDAEDICSICQEVLLEKKLPVTFCRFGCGNSVHIKCMKILANYQDVTSKVAMLKCPLCRKEFVQLSVLLEEFQNSSKLVAAAEKEPLNKHLGIPCNNCKQFPIEGTCYKCSECVEYHLCQECFDNCSHLSHTFTFREKRNQKWKLLEKASDDDTKCLDVKKELEETVPQFQEKKSQVYTPKDVVKSLPLQLITKKSKLLAPGYQCRLCLKSFHVGQQTRLLPCTHKFHRKCIDKWLLHKCNSCPIDGQVIYNPLMWKGSAVNGQAHPCSSNVDIIHLPKQEPLKLFIPGTRLVLKQSRYGILPSIPQCDSQKLTTPQNPSEIYQNITIDDLCSVKLDDTNSRKLIHEYEVSQHLPRYLQDLPTGSFGKTVCQTFLPSLTQENIICLNGIKIPGNHKKCSTSQSQKTSKGCKYINRKPKKNCGVKTREENRRSNMLLPEDLHLTLNGTTTKLNLPKRHNNCMEKLRQKCIPAPRQPMPPSLQAKST
ncbi:E3 ubiquitin-protein ligase ZSWIM2 [Perognathus longimembris pacificus]|uniref:E3 ubiquitin-protein ligase ZSWIM2 n=1 Tax=Perognathus longimembris pacificus TaxID=214514 RepID=UPI002018DB21|nr:E3 ubiquitin-protein ligase ZSWIM2 [Perognathus longimembris pacificus]